MGIDVNGVFEKQDGERWVYVGEFDDGQRGFLRFWLGWGSGWYSRYGIAPIAGASRGLPAELLGCADGTYWIDPEYRINTKRAALVGEQQHSWLSGEEILAALPVTGMRRHLVPSDTANRLMACDADLNQWAAEISGEHQWGEVPRLVAVSARPEAIAAEDPDGMPVDCTWDFSEYIAHFTDEVRRQTALHGRIRFVYGFS